MRCLFGCCRDCDCIHQMHPSISQIACSSRGRSKGTMDAREKGVAPDNGIRGSGTQFSRLSPARSFNSITLSAHFPCLTYPCRCRQSFLTDWRRATFIPFSPFLQTNTCPCACFAIRGLRGINLSSFIHVRDLISPLNTSEHEISL